MTFFSSRRCNNHQIERFNHRIFFSPLFSISVFSFVSFSSLCDLVSCVDGKKEGENAPKDNLISSNDPFARESGFKVLD